MKKLLALVLSVVMAASLTVPAFAATAAGASRINITLDGYTLVIPDGVSPEMKDGRTMVPIRAVSEALGADVGWDQAARQVTLTRAGVTIVMTVGSKTAYVDGRAVEMDVAPYITSGRTLIPARYVAEFFGQKVGWDGAKRTVSITEDKSVVGESNLERWAIPMGAVQLGLNEGSHRWFAYKRAFTVSAYTPNVPFGGKEVLPSVRCRDMLSDSWDINSREDLIVTVCSLPYYGHNENFLEDVAYINALTPAQYNQYLNSDGMDSYMFPYTKQLGEKWGDRGILCWDLFRVSSLVQFGYTAGYVTYAEALALLEPAATLLCENFSSWEEAYENYLEGYNWWARNDVLDKNIWEVNRGNSYKTIVADKQYNVLDDTLFETGVIPVPGVTAEQLLEQVLEQVLADGSAN